MLSCNQNAFTIKIIIPNTTKITPVYGKIYPPTESGSNYLSTKNQLCALDSRPYPDYPSWKAYMEIRYQEKNKKEIKHHIPYVFQLLAKHYFFKRLCIQRKQIGTVHNQTANIRKHQLRGYFALMFLKNQDSQSRNGNHYSYH